MNEQQAYRPNKVVIEGVYPEIDCGTHPIKRSVGEAVRVHADILAHGRDRLAAHLLYAQPQADEWTRVPMHHVVNDRWEGEFSVSMLGVWRYTLEAWVDEFASWQEMLQSKLLAQQASKVDMLVGVELLEKLSHRANAQEKAKLGEYIHRLQEASLEQAAAIALTTEIKEAVKIAAGPEHPSRYEKDLECMVESRKALFSTWYEIFPRSFAPEPGAHGTLRDCVRLLPRIKRMGFDVLYLTPIHPIGTTGRKGKENTLVATSEDVGSPWAIGSREGGHKSIHPRLGSLEDFDYLLAEARAQEIEIAMDIAFQCSPDHPYVREHPEWFRWHPDGSIQHAENPPKKYEDIIPFNFHADSWQELWEELKSIVVFWAERGVRIFRIDNPHTKPFFFWQWLIHEVQQAWPETIFLSEAFTRPKVMGQLAKVGFSQSYTYFTWRNTKEELRGYLQELTQTELQEYLRPNFWPNTPDILPEYLQYGGRPAFIIRLILAATLSSNYGIYGPAFECIASEAMPGKEEYRHSEKYQLHDWALDAPENLEGIIARVNEIRREHPALQATRNLSWYEVDNEHLLFYGKTTENKDNVVLVLVNLDPYHTQSGWVHLPLDALQIPAAEPYLVHDLLGGDRYIWQGEDNYVEVNPHILPAHILALRRRMRRETDFDYFM